MVHGTSTLRPVKPYIPIQPKPVVTTPSAGSTPSDPDTGAADFKALFTPKITSSAAPPPTPPASPAPTAESVFGPNPWVTNPTGIGPTGTYTFNPYYFATPDTAAKVAQMVGGTVVSSNQFTADGTGFTQQQPNLMVQLPNDHLINPGLIASFYTHGYPQSYVDQMVANEVQNG